MKLEELQVYQLSMDLGERIWKIVIEWDYSLDYLQLWFSSPGLI
ncbi:MAG: hypothetical protein V3U19_08560 [Thermodesulfobacteriota bacterium]|jgi:hypothetical protein